MVANVMLLLVLTGCVVFIGYVVWIAVEVREEIERERQLQEHRERCQRLVRSQQAALRADRRRIQAELDRRLDAHFRERTRQRYR